MIGDDFIMKSQNQAPWVGYLKINKKTGKRELKKDTPNEIKKAYELYLKENEKLTKQNISISK